MRNVALKTLRGKRILLLQGPVGPFFWRLRKDLESASAHVFKINLNGGDCLFYPKNYFCFRGRREEWPAYLEDVIDRLRVDTLILFGDCRTYHQAAIELAKIRRLDIRVFEEGYFRPDYISFEAGGVNGYSHLPSDPDHYRSGAPYIQEPRNAIGNSFWHVAMWAIFYYLAAVLSGPIFKHYRHHRPLRLAEGWYWIRSLWRKLIYSFKEQKFQRRLYGKSAQKFFLVPLQTHNDHQITVHSDYFSVEQFIEEIVASFAKHAPRDSMIVVKHHPMDRGYRDYTALFERTRTEYALGDRLVYLHDLHLPTLLKRAAGVVVINSTVGLSALFHGTPVKACGRAIYDICGLTYQGELKSFWQEAEYFAFDRKLYQAFRNYVISQTQINGNFYKRLDRTGYRSGMCWRKHLEKNSDASIGEIDLNFANSKAR